MEQNATGRCLCSADLVLICIKSPPKIVQNCCGRKTRVFGIGKLLKDNKKDNKKVGRGPGKPITDKEKIRNEKFMRFLERSDPDKYNELMLQKLGYRTRKEDPLDNALEVMRKIRELVPSRDPENIGEGENLKDLVIELAKTPLGNAVGAILVSHMAPTAIPATPPEQRPTQVIVESQAQELPTGDAKMSLISAYLINGLNGKTPEQAVQWLHGLKRQELDDFLIKIARTPDDQMRTVLQEAVNAEPDLYGVINWFSTRADYFFKIVSVVRAELQAAPPSANGKIKVQHGL